MRKEKKKVKRKQRRKRREKGGKAFWVRKVKSEERVEGEEQREVRNNLARYYWRKEM